LSKSNQILSKFSPISPNFIQIFPNLTKFFPNLTKYWPKFFPNLPKKKLLRDAAAASRSKFLATASSASSDSTPLVLQIAKSQYQKLDRGEQTVNNSRARYDQENGSDHVKSLDTKRYHTRG